jgi:hypothetical protein
MKPKPDLTDQELERLLPGVGRLEAAPEAVIQRAIGVWQSPQPTALEGVLKRVLAVLTFDSGGADALAFGRRSSSAGDRQLLFSVEGRDIDLRVSPVAGSRGELWSLSGQVLGPDLEATVELRVDAYTGSVALNDLAEFRFEGVPQGECHLMLRSPQAVIELPPIRIPLAG